MLERDGQPPIVELTSIHEALTKVIVDSSEREKVVLAIRNASPSPLELQDGILVVNVENEDVVRVVRSGVKDRKALEGMVVITDDGKLPEWLGDRVDELGKARGVWIFEKCRALDDEEKEARESLLESWGLVERKVVMVRQSEYSVWYGRTEKSRKNVGVDLTVKPKFGFMVRDVQRRLIKEGWESAQLLPETLENCRRSKFPPQDYQDVRLAIDTWELRAPCGCVWKGENLAHQCSPDCEGRPARPQDREALDRLGKKREETLRVKGKPFWVGSNIPASECGVQRSCFCGEELQFDRRRERVEGDKVVVLSELKCPRHGSKGVREMKIDPKIIKEWEK